MTKGPQAGAGAGRNRYVDLVRLVAIVVVVVGHWLDTTIVLEHGQPVGESALAVVGYARWFTLPLQVMPLFFLAGGYGAAASWPAWTARGGRWSGWTYGRLLRLLRPTSWFVGVMAGLAALASLLGVDPAVLAQAGWGVALQLWFLPVYLPLLVLAVPLMRVWSRAGWLVLAACVVLVATVDLLVRTGQVPAASWVSFLAAPGAGFVLGIAWQAGALARRAVQVAMCGGGLLALVVLVAVFAYPPWMIGIPGEPTSNTAPPNLALLAFSAAQVGAVLLVEPLLRRWLGRPRVWAGIVTGNAVVMTMYLWHMVPVLVLAVLADAAGLLPSQRAGTLSWWALRPVWIGALALVLAGVVRLVGRFERPAPPHLHLAGRTASALLLVATALACFALSRLALHGFTPSGHLAVGTLLVYAAGIFALRVAAQRDERP